MAGFPQHRLRRRGPQRRHNAIGAVRFLDAVVHKAKAMPDGADANAVTTAFLQNRSGMMILSTGALWFVWKDALMRPYVEQTVLNVPE